MSGLDCLLVLMVEGEGRVSDWIEKAGPSS